MRGFPQGHRLLKITAWSLSVVTLFFAEQATPYIGDPTVNTQVPFQPANLGKYDAATLAFMKTFNMGSLGSCVSAQVENIAQVAVQSTGLRGVNVGQRMASGSVYGPDCGNDSVPQIGDSCALVNSGDRFSKQKATQLENQIKDALNAISCKDRKIKSIQGHMSCLQEKAKDLQMWVDTSKGQLDSVISKAKSDLSEITQIVESRRDQLGTLNKRLNGDRESGTVGLREIKEMTFKLVTDTMPMGIREITDFEQKVGNQIDLLEDLRKSERARIAGSCFVLEVRRPDYLCSKNSAPVSARDFALCMVEQRSLLSGNQIVRSAEREAEAKKRRRSLETILRNIEGDLPIQQFVPTGKGGEQMVRLSKPNRVLSPEDIDARYGAQLKAVKVQDFNVYQFVKDAYSACYTQANRDAKVLEQKPGENLYNAHQVLQNMQDEQQTRINKLLTIATDKYDEITKALTGLSVPIDPRKCRESPTNEQINCLKQLESSMRNLMSGVGEVSPHHISVPGIVKNQMIDFYCTGVNGCIAAYEGYYRVVDQEVKRVDNGRTQFISSSNSNLQKVTNDIKKQVATQFKDIETYKETVNRALSNVEVSSLLEFSKPQPEAPTFEGGDPSKGIMNSPTDFAKFLGLPDLGAGEVFSKVQQGLSSAKGKLEEKRTKAEREKNSVATLIDRCKSEKAKASAKVLATAMDNWNAKGCSNWEKVGEETKKNELDRLAESIKLALPEASGRIDSADFSKLSQPIEGYNEAEYKRANDEVLKIEDELTAADTEYKRCMLEFAPSDRSQMPDPSKYDPARCAGMQSNANSIQTRLADAKRKAESIRNVAGCESIYSNLLSSGRSFMDSLKDSGAESKPAELKREKGDI